MAKHVALPGIIVAFMLTWIAEELKAWLPWCTRRFFDLSVRLLPSSERERYSEEWRERVDSLPGASLGSAQFLWAALEIRALVTKEVFLETWMQFRVQTTLLFLLVYCSLSVRMARLFGTQRPIALEGSAESSNQIAGLVLIAIALLWLEQSSKQRSAATA